MTKIIAQPIGSILDLPGIHRVSTRYGSHWQKLSKATKWVLCAILSFEASAYCTEAVKKGKVPVDILEDIDPMLDAVGLTLEERGDIYFIIGEISSIDEIEQARLVSALSNTIAAGIYAGDFSDLFVEN